MSVPRKPNVSIEPYYLALAEEEDELTRPDPSRIRPEEDAADLLPDEDYGDEFEGEEEEA